MHAMRDGIMILGIGFGSILVVVLLFYGIANLMRYLNRG